MGNFSVIGVMLAYMPASLPMRQFGVVANPPERGPEVHAAVHKLVADGAVRPVIGRRIGLGQVAAALEDHEQRRTSGRTVVDLSLPA
jgi:NADPH2:quinone reductase